MGRACASGKPSGAFIAFSEEQPANISDAFVIESDLNLVRSIDFRAEQSLNIFDITATDDVSRLRTSTDESE